jgi:hypothetical protein
MHCGRGVKRFMASAVVPFITVSIRITISLRVPKKGER